MKKITQNLTNLKAWQSTIFAFMFLFSLTINSQEVGQEYLANPTINTTETSPDTGSVVTSGNFSGDTNAGGWGFGQQGAYAPTSGNNGDCYSEDRQFKMFKKNGEGGVQYITQTITALPAGNYNWSYWNRWAAVGGTFPSWSAEGDSTPKFVVLTDDDGDGTWTSVQDNVSTEPTDAAWYQESGTYTNDIVRDVKIKFTKTGGADSSALTNLAFLWFLDNASFAYASALAVTESNLEFKGVIDFSVNQGAVNGDLFGGSDGKAVHFVATADIADMSIYSVNLYANGGTSVSNSFEFPAGSASAGDEILVARSIDAMNYYMDASTYYTTIIDGSGWPTSNGDDALELMSGAEAIDVFGVIGVDGSGEAWEYTDSWAYKVDGAWTYGAVNTTDGTETICDAAEVYPFVSELCAVSTFNVTFSVNTANITVGENGMYAGGGVLGGSDAYAMTDDGTGTWTVTIALNEGTSGNYIFLNSPNGSSDWGTKEDLAGQECADAGNYNDRILAAVTADTTLLHCFGSCETDGTCGSPAEPVLMPVDHENANVTYAWNDFGGAATTVIANPDASGINTSATVAQSIKTAGSETWAGTFIVLDEQLDFSTLTSLSVDVWTPDGGELVNLKVENAADANIFIELNQPTTVASGWETLTYDLSGQDLSQVYNKLVLFFDFNVAGDDTAYFFDNIRLVETVVPTACGDTVVYTQVANGDFTETITAPDGQVASVTINATMEVNWDSIIVTDGAGNQLNEQIDGDFVDAVYTSSDATITVNVLNDASVQNGDVTLTFACEVLPTGCGDTVVYTQVANGDFTETITAAEDQLASVTINATMEVNWDSIIVTDGAGNQLNEQIDGDFVDVVYYSSDSTITVNVLNDASVQNGDVTLAFTCVALSTTDNELLEMLIYPNPVSGDYVTIQTPVNGVKYVEVFDITGKRLINTSLSADTLDVSSISSGLYLVKVTVEGQSKTSKLIIR